MSSTPFQPILDAAFADYFKETGIDPAKHPFAGQLLNCRSPDDVLKLLENKANEFKDYREGNRKLIDCLKPVVNVIQAFSSVLGEAVSLPFQPANAIFVGVDILLAAATGVSSSYDALVDLFDCVGNFLKRLRIYTNIPLTPSMMEIVATIMAEFLSVLALATKQIKLGRFKKFARKLLGESEIEAVLQRLDRLTKEEGRMTLAQTLQVVHCLMNNVKVVMNDGRASMDGIWKALDTMQMILSDINKMSRDQLRRDSRSWLTPPDPSTNYNIACETHQDGTARWFFKGSAFTEWNAKGSLLWIYGKPGSGKSILMSSIIQEIDRMCKAGLASMAYFYFDFRDTQKQHRRGLLSSLLSQLSAESDACHHILSQLYSAHAGGTRQPSEDSLSQCLMEMLEVQGQPAMYIIIDALDECPNISGMPTAREKVLKFLGGLVRSPNVHICLSSRPEFDIRTSLEPLASFRVSLDDETGQKADILEYVKSVVHSDRRMQSWSTEDKQLVISTLSDKADGMFRWVYCQLENLRECFPSSIRSTLDGLPKTLDATYEYTLLGIGEEKWQFAHRLLQSLSVSIGSLRVEELAEILAVRFDGALPQFNAGWQPGNAEEAVLSACSSLISVVNVNGSRIVQFAHFSVKEFLTSDRLAKGSENLSRYYIVPRFAHTILAQASLGVLLQLDNRIDKESIRNFPLADYAARHWFDHCQSGNVLSTIQDATKCIFEREQPHFSAWVWIYDIDDPWGEYMPTEHPEQPVATPLYYAILCGLPWLIEHLVVTYPKDVDARGGYHETPLLAAIGKEGVSVTSSPPEHDADVNVLGNMGPLHRAWDSEHVDIVRLLLQHNADANLQNKKGETALYRASRRGNIQILKLLVKHGADVQSRDKSGGTSLKVASRNGHLDAVQFLIDHGADVNSQDNMGWTPCHSASQGGNVNIAELLIQHGADVNKKNDEQDTPLHIASSSGNLEIVQLLVQHDVDVQSQGKSNWTPLKIASHHGHLDIVRFLIESYADVNSKDDDGWTPLHSASLNGHANIAELLIQHGADVNKKSDKQDTPLHIASSNGYLEIVQLLVQHGADVQFRNKVNWIPLELASHGGHLDVVQCLINSGADVNSQDDNGWTPLHSASQQGHANIVELLIQHGADINKKNDKQDTPLLLASSRGNLEIVQFLVQHGAYVQCRNRNNWTPLKFASHHGHLDIVRFLISRGADVNSQDDDGWTPLHSASREGHANIAELLIQHGADVNKKSDEQDTPLHIASSSGNLEIVRLLVQHGADMQFRNKDNWIPLELASHHGHLDIVRFLTSCGADANSQDDSGWTPLHSASKQGHVNIAELLIQHGADVNKKSDKQDTPLLLASASGNFEIVQLLVRHGADVQSWDNSNWTPLKFASHHGHLDMVRFLINSRADVNFQDDDGWTPLHSASREGHANIVELLIQHGADVNKKSNEQDTPLLLASSSGNLEIVQLLVQHGAYVQVRNRSNWTPLKFASHHGHLDIVRFLTSRGADVNSQDDDGWTPLHSASRNGHANIVELLIQHGADVDKKSDEQDTPLSLASSSGNLEIVQLLVRHGAGVQFRNKSNWIPLELASQDGHLDIVRFLIEGGADVNCQDDDGWTPLHSASLQGHVNIVELLIQHGAEVNKKSDEQGTPLKLASHHGHLDVVRFLIDSGADVNSQDNAGCTPLHSALKRGHVNIIELLIQRGADVNKKSDEQDSLLHFASEGGQLNIVRSLLDGGSDVNERNIRRETALVAASMYGKLEVAKLLIERGGDVDSRDKDGQTPLITALQCGRLEVARLLLDHGADVNASTRGYHTALHVASASGNFEMVQLLLERGANCVDVQDVDGVTPRQLAIRLLGHRKVAELFSGFGEHREGVTIQGAPTSRYTPASPLEISVDALVPVSAPPAPASTPGTQFTADRNAPARTSVSSHGRSSAPPRGTARAMRSYPALPEVSDPPRRPIPANVYPRSTAPCADDESVSQGREDRDPYRESSVGVRLKPTIDAATTERNKATQTAQWTGWVLNAAIAIQVLIAASIAALCVAVRATNELVAITTLGGALTLTASYLAHTRGSKKHSALLMRVKVLNRFLRELEAFQLDHGHEVGRQWDEKINGFRLSLEIMLDNESGSITTNPEAAGTDSGSAKKGSCAASPLPGSNETGTSVTNAKLTTVTI